MYKNKLLCLCLILVMFFSVISTGFAAEKEEYLRVVSLKPNITKSLVALGLADKLVGVTKFCEKPNNNAIVVADYNSLDVEKIIRLKPDLIIGSAENSQKAQYQRLITAKLNVQLFDFSTYAKLIDSLTKMGELFNVKEKAAAVITGMQKKMGLLSQVLGEESNKTFIAIIQRQPVMIASGNTYISTLFEEIGLRNNFGFNKIAYPVVDEEEIIREFVTYTFDFSHDLDEQDTYFLNKTVIPLKLSDFLAAPQSVDNLLKVFHVNKITS